MSGQITTLSRETQTGTVAAASSGTGMSVENANGYCLTVETTVTTAAAITFVDADVHVVNNTIAETAHGYYTGLKVAATTAGVLPTGLSATDYYVIRVSADLIKLASSAANAIAGTAVDITAAAGGGTHTLTPAALAGASYKLQGAMRLSNGDAGTYIDLAVTNNVTATANFIHEKVEPMYDFVRIVWTMTAGQILYTAYLAVKGEE